MLTAFTNAFFPYFRFIKVADSEEKLFRPYNATAHGYSRIHYNITKEVDMLHKAYGIKSICASNCRMVIETTVGEKQMSAEEEHRKCTFLHLYFLG